MFIHIKNISKDYVNIIMNINNLIRTTNNWHYPVNITYKPIYLCVYNELWAKLRENKYEN